MRLLSPCLTNVSRAATILPMSRPRHPDKHLERAVRYAESQGWRVELSEGPTWGHLLCPRSTRDGCIVGVYCTPVNPESGARRITRLVDLCPHKEEG